MSFYIRKIFVKRVYTESAYTSSIYTKNTSIKGVDIKNTLIWGAYTRNTYSKNVYTKSAYIKDIWSICTGVICIKDIYSTKSVYIKSVGSNNICGSAYKPSKFFVKSARLLIKLIFNMLLSFC